MLMSYGLSLEVRIVLHLGKLLAVESGAHVLTCVVSPYSSSVEHRLVKGI